MISVPIDKIFALEELEKKAHELIAKTHGKDFYIFTKEDKPVVALLDVDYLIELTKSQSSKEEISGSKSQKPFNIPNSQVKPITPSIKPINQTKKPIPPLKSLNELKSSNQQFFDKSQSSTKNAPFAPISIPPAQGSNTLNSNSMYQPLNKPVDLKQNSAPMATNTSNISPLTPVPPAKNSSVLSTMGITTPPKTIDENIDSTLSTSDPADSKSPAQYDGNSTMNTSSVPSASNGTRLIDLNNAKPSMANPNSNIPTTQTAQTAPNIDQASLAPLSSTISANTSPSTMPNPAEPTLQASNVNSSNSNPQPVSSTPPSSLPINQSATPTTPPVVPQATPTSVSPITTSTPTSSTTTPASTPSASQAPINTTNTSVSSASDLPIAPPKFPSGSNQKSTDKASDSITDMQI